MRTEHRHRDGDTMVTVTVEMRPAVIDFDEILDAVKVEADDSLCEAPWDNCDGYEHVLRVVDNHEQRNARGCVFHNRSHHVIDLLPADPRQDDFFKWHRENGASRQVAAEMVARDRQRRLGQLARWYEHGWEWLRVGCEYLGVCDGVCGVDDFDYAAGDLKREIASNVAAELEDRGYTVINQPDWEAMRNEHKRGRSRFGLTVGTWR